jgi:hypothetical protein
LWIGCATNDPPPTTGIPGDSPERQLAADLALLANDADEPRLLARAAIAHSRSLAAEYRIARPPLLHNVLVNVGIKERGLCWHWTEDLLARLDELSLEHYELHWGTAYRGRLFREHNTVIVTAKGSPLETGIVLDPWRGSGQLYWTPVSDDSYPWEPH